MSGTQNDEGESSKDSGKKISTLGKAFSKIDLDGHDLPPSPTPSSPRNGKRYALATELVYTENGDQYNSSSMPIYQVSSDLNSSADANLLNHTRNFKGRGAAVNKGLTDSSVSLSSLPHSSKRREEVEINTTIQDRETLQGHI